jgi:hypothetical protein
VHCRAPPSLKSLSRWHDRRVSRHAPVALVLIAGCAGLAGCASKAEPTRHPRGPEAETPESAAIGFDQSVRGNGVLKYGCLPVKEFSWYGEDVNGTPAASATRIGGRWIVSVTYSSPVQVSSRYEVRRLADGYCVSRMLPDLPPESGPSSPGSGPGSYSPS